MLTKKIFFKHCHRKVMVQNFSEKLKKVPYSWYKAIKETSIAFIKLVKIVAKNRMHWNSIDLSCIQNRNQEER
jgi:hypothetical protein